MSKKVVKKVVKKQDKNLLLILLYGIEAHGDNLKILSEKLNMSKQNLNYYLKRLLDMNYIKKIQSKPFAIYKLSSTGRVVKKSSHIARKSQSNIPLWNCHNQVISFKIYDFGKYHFPINTKKMNNWHFAQHKTGKFKIQILSTGLIRIYCPPKTSFNPDKAFTELQSQAQKIAQEYCNNYDMKMGFANISREGHKALLNSEPLAKLFGRFKNKELWTDKSDKKLEFEELQSTNYIKEFLSLPSVLKEFLKGFDIYNENIKLHLEVIRKIGEAQEESTKINKKMLKALEGLSKK